MAPARPGDEASESAGAADDGRDALEVAVEAWFADRRRGDSSDPADYARRAPGREAEFHELIGALGVLESAAAAVKRADAAGAMPTRIGRFELVRRVGRGGMGAVYEAHDRELGRRVALKVLPTVAALDERELARFRRESEAVARLRHPHVVPLLGAGEDDGVHWIAMEFIDGTSLADRGLRLAARDVARHGLALAEALACAHAEGIVHRDVKPSNVLLDRSGAAWITDFGLSSAVGATAITRTGESLGTPRYMAPESFAGWADPRTDLWGVGVTLYELLAGRPAFDGVDRARLMKQIVDGEPPALRTLDPALPRDLATIVHHCLEKEPGARYATAAALADDLHCYLEGAPIRARPPALADRLARAARRHRAATLVAGAAFLLLAALVIGWAETLRRRNVRLAEETARSTASLAVAGDVIARVLDEAASDVLLRAPSLDPLRRRLLESALEFEERLLAGQGESADKQLDVALAELRVGAIEWELGRLDESRDRCARAETLLRELATGGSGGSVAAFALAEALAGQACVARDRGDVAAAEAALRDALAHVERAIGGAPTCVDDAHHLAFGATLLADLLARDRRAGEGAALLHATLPRCEPWLARDDAKPRALRVLRDARVELAECEEQSGDPAAAVAALAPALLLCERLVAVDRSDVRPAEYCAARRSWLGSLLRTLGRDEEAQALLSAARAELESIVERWPMVPEFRRDLADALAREAAEPQLSRAIELADGALAERLDDASFARTAVHARNRLATWRDDGGDADGAWEVARAATELLERRDRARSSWPALLQEQAAVAWQDRGYLELELGRLDDAHRSLARAAEWAAAPADRRGDTRFARELRLRIALTQGSLLAAREDGAGACAAWAAVATEAGRSDAAKEPDVAALRVQSQNLAANVLMRSGDLAGANALLGEALTGAAELRARWPARADFTAALGMARGDAGFLAYRASDPVGARRELLAAIALLHEALGRDPRQRSWRAALAIVLDVLAGALQPPRDDGARAELAALLDAVEAATAGSDDAALLVESARVFARAAAIDPTERAARADAAMERLVAARAAGYRDAARMGRDVAFDALRGRDDFAQWLTSLAESSR